MNLKTLGINALLVVAVVVGYHFFINKNSSSLAYVDTAKLMQEYKGMEAVKKLTETKEKEWQASIDTLTQELQSEIKKYEKERSSMTEKEKKATESLLGHKQQQYMQYRDGSKNKLAEEQQKITNEALVKVNSIIADFGKKNNYTIILGTTSGNILYANQGIEITDKVLEVLNN